MAVHTVALTLPADYTSHSAAVLGGLLANSDEIQTIESGTYGPQTLNVSGFTGIEFTRADGVDYTIRLDTTLPYSFTVGDGFAMTRGTVSCTANAPVRSVGAAFNFDGVTFQVDSGHSAAIAYPASTSTVTLNNCRFIGDAQTITGGWTMLTNSSISMSGCSVSDVFTFSDGFVRMSGATSSTASVLGCGIPSNALLYVRPGQTVASVTIKGCASPHLVDNDGTITAFVGDYNAYNTTDPNTDSATDRDGITDFDLDWRGKPNPTSPLYRFMPAGVHIGGNLDADGDPRQAGGRQDCGPKQNQHDPRLDAIMAAVYA